MKDKVILLVEDNTDDAVLTLHAFEKNRILSEVVLAGDGEECLDYLFGQGRFAGRNLKIMPALVLLDLALPKLGGFDVLRRIRSDARTQHIPVVILTASADEKDLREGYRLGANSFVRKPVDFEAFSETVRQLGEYWLRINEIPSRPVSEPVRRATFAARAIESARA